MRAFLEIAIHTQTICVHSMLLCASSWALECCLSTSGSWADISAHNTFNPRFNRKKKIYVSNPVATPPSVRLGMIKMQRGNMLSCAETTTLVTLSAHEMPGPPLLGILSMSSSQRKRGRQTDIQRHTHIHLKQNCGFHIIRIAELFCCWSCFKLVEFSSCSTVWSFIIFLSHLWKSSKTQQWGWGGSSLGKAIPSFSQSMARLSDQ